MHKEVVKTFTKKALNKSYKKVDPDTLIPSEVSEGGWLSDPSLRYAHSKGSLNFRYEFGKEDLPSRVLNLNDKLYEEFFNYLKDVKSLSRISSSKVRIVIRVFTKNLSRCKHYDQQILRVYLHKKYWKSFKNLSHTYFMYLLDMLESRNLLSIYRGYVDKYEESVKSLIVIHSDVFKGIVGDREPEFYKILPVKRELLEIRDNQGSPKKIKGKEKVEVQKLRNLIERYNTILEERTIEIGGIAIPEIYFRRVFNEDLATGGRFYDCGYSIQRQSKDTRATTKIDGEDIVSLDFKSIHPCIAAEILGVKLEHDPYQSQELDLLFELDYKHLEQNPNHNPVRSFCKTALLTMFNCKDVKQAVGAVAYALKRDRSLPEECQEFFGIVGTVPVKKVVEALIELNKPIASFICNQKGGLLQNLDSQIIEYCIERHIEIDEVVIPVHDCCIVRESMEERTLGIMREAYKSVLGSDMNCIIEKE